MIYATVPPSACPRRWAAPWAAPSAPPGGWACAATSRRRRWSIRCSTSRASCAPIDRRVTNVVFMGMGEPFHNYDETLRACRLLNDDGRVRPGGACHLRLHGGRGAGHRPLRRGAAAAQPRREPARRHGRAARPARAAQPHVPARRRCSRRARATCAARTASCCSSTSCSRGVNDTDEQVQMLAARVRPPHYHLNLIAYNETGGAFARPAADRRWRRSTRRLEAAGRELHGASLAGGGDRGRLRPARAAARRPLACLSPCAGRLCRRQGRAQRFRGGLRVDGSTSAISAPSSNPAIAVRRGAISTCQW